MDSQIDVEFRGDVHCVRLRNRRMNEDDLYHFGEELNRLVKDGCRKMVLILGPESPLCLYSIFLAKLVSLQKRLREAGGALKLASVGPEIRKIFEVCQLHSLFEFCPDPETAVADLSL